MFIVSLLVVVVLQFCGTFYCQNAVYADDAMADLRSSWTSREQGAMTVFVELRAFVVSPPIASSFVGKPTNGVEAVQVEERKELRIKGEKLATLSVVTAGKEAMRPDGVRLAFDGTTALSYNGVPHAPGVLSTGTVSNDPSKYARMAELAPIYLQVRGSHPELHAVDLEEFSLAEGDTDVLGHRCVALKKVGQNGYLEFLYCDPDRDYSIRRYEVLYEGKAVQLVDIEYSGDSPIPNSWELSLFRRDTGENYYRSKSEVVRSEINSEIPDSEFTFSFPDHTLVIDEIKKTKYIVGDQPLVETLGEAEGGEQKDLVPNSTSSEKGGLFPGWVIYGNLCVLIAFVLYRVFIRRKASSA